MAPPTRRPSITPSACSRSSSRRSWRSRCSTSNVSHATSTAICASSRSPTRSSITCGTSSRPIAELKDTTTLVVLPEHGRHLFFNGNNPDSLGRSGIDHGQGDDGDRNVWMLALGPDIKPNQVIAPTGIVQTGRTSGRYETIDAVMTAMGLLGHDAAMKDALVADGARPGLHDAGGAGMKRVVALSRRRRPVGCGSDTRSDDGVDAAVEPDPLLVTDDGGARQPRRSARADHREALLGSARALPQRPVRAEPLDAGADVRVPRQPSGHREVGSPARQAGQRGAELVHRQDPQPQRRRDADAARRRADGRSRIAELEAWINAGALRAPGRRSRRRTSTTRRSAPQIGIFNGSGTRLDGAGPVTVAAGTTLTLRHTVQDFETADSAIRSRRSSCRSPTAARSCINATGTDPHVGQTTYDAAGPMAQGRRLRLQARVDNPDDAQPARSEHRHALECGRLRPDRVRSSPSTSTAHPPNKASSRSMSAPR